MFSEAWPESIVVQINRWYKAYIFKTTCNKKGENDIRKADIDCNMSLFDQSRKVPCLFVSQQKVESNFPLGLPRNFLLQFHLKIKQFGTYCRIRAADIIKERSCPISQVSATSEKSNFRGNYSYEYFNRAGRKFLKIIQY